MPPYEWLFFTQELGSLEQYRGTLQAFAFETRVGPFGLRIDDWCRPPARRRVLRKMYTSSSLAKMILRTPKGKLFLLCMDTVALVLW